jgi:hypothetical protein
VWSPGTRLRTVRQNTTAATTQRYAHLADDPPLRAATERFGSKIAGFREGK